MACEFKADQPKVSFGDGCGSIFALHFSVFSAKLQIGAVQFVKAAGLSLGRYAQPQLGISFCFC